MNITNLLLIVLIVIALAMIGISFKAGILPPGLTGLGFIIIAYLIKINHQRNQV
jgi:hypothetical protein